MIKRHNGEPNIQGFKKAASTAFANGDVVTKDASGYLVLATSSTARNAIIGVIQRDVVSTDSDYADNSVVPVEVPRKTDQFVIPVTTGTATQAMVNKAYDLDDENGLDVSAQTVGAVTIDKFISATEVVGHFNIEDATA